MTYARIENAIRQARRNADAGGIAWRVTEVPFGPEIRYGVNHINCDGWGKIYPTVVIVYPKQ